MREPKFRVYNKATRSMEYSNLHDIKDIENAESLVIMQNTGHKDAYLAYGANG